MATSVQEIVSLWQRRKAERNPLFAKMEDVRRHYNGEVVVPLPEIDDVEKPAVANLVGQGLDQFAMRVASVMPDIACPPLRPGIDTSDERARVRRLANLNWWDMNRMGLKLRKRARLLLGYGTSPVSISAVSANPLDTRPIPHWRVRDPLCSFPAPCEDTDDVEPSDCIFSFRQTLGWLKQRYPDQVARLHKGTKNSSRDGRFEILEYNDAEETVLIAVGAERGEHDYVEPGDGYSQFVELERIPNRAGIPLMVVPGRITLDKIMGAFDGILGMFDRQAKLDALETIAIQRGIFPDEWIVSYPQNPGTAEVVVDADGLEGIRGEIKGGDIKWVTMNTPYLAPQALDRLERAQRLTAGIPAEFGAESPSNVRTARRGEMVMGAAVDMPVQEAQEIFQASLEAENRRAIAIQKAYRGQVKCSFYVPQKGKSARVDYVPDEAFETDWNVVKYSMAGTDVNGMVIAMGQRVSVGEMSMQTFREMDPAVEDAIEERDRVEIEGLRKALLASLEMRAQQGNLSPVEIARLAQLKLEKHLVLEDAVMEANKELQSQQAAPPPPGAPEAQPGMAPPGAPSAPVPPPGPGQLNLAQILSTLRSPANQSPAERQMAPPQ